MSLRPNRFVDSEPMFLAGLRRHHTLGSARVTIPAQWEASRSVMDVSGRRGTMSYGVVCGMSRDGQTFEYMSGVEVASFDEVPRELGRMHLPRQRYAVFAHHGSVRTIRATWDAIRREWLPWSGLQAADTPALEVYDERYDAATGLGGIEIWWPVVDREREGIVVERLTTSSRHSPEAP